MTLQQKVKYVLQASACAVLVCILTFLAWSSPLAAQQKLPSDLEGIGIDEHRGEKIDLDLPFQDENGLPVTLRKYFSGTKPVVLALVYYGCPNICTFVLNGTMDSLKKVDLNPGEKFEVLAVSIDPSETAALSKEKKASYLEYFGKGHEEGFHFLVGAQASITKLTNQIGFKYKWVEEQKQFAHSSALFILTPDGRISRYLYGIMYPPRDVKMALLEASDGKIGTFVDRILLFCFYYDAATKKYVLLASRLMTGAGAVTLAALTIFLSRFWLKERRLTALKLAQRG